MKSIHKCGFYLNFLNNSHFPTKWQMSLINEMGWAFDMDYIHIKFEIN